MITTGAEDTIECPGNDSGARPIAHQEGAGAYPVFKPAEFVAVIGPSGCGKSTMLRQLVSSSLSSIAGVGYLPQFGAVQPDLTVEEVLYCASKLRTRQTQEDRVLEKIAEVTDVTGVRHKLSQRCGTLSGGELRRLALAEVLLGDPDILFLDELTSGLDPHSERELMWFLRQLANDRRKTILLVTHATGHLNLCDRVLFLNKGRQMFFGTYEELLANYSVADIADVYESVVNDDAAELRDKPQAVAVSFSGISKNSGVEESKPGPSQQFWVLLWRQWILFFRDRGQLGLHIALALTFPLIVAVFAYKGLPQVRQLTLQLETNIVNTLAEQLLFMRESFKAAALISGLAMFQVVLLTLVGANNGAREIAKERDVLAKERYSGLSPGAYVAGKFLQILLLSFVQALWMAWFVKLVCGFPGSLLNQFGALFATTLAMSSTCLAISAGTKSPERASLLSIYLVGFQLPLSGAALALPDWLAVACRPFIAAYWGWSGFLKTLSETRHYDIVRQSTATWIAPYDLSLFVLGLHVVLSLGAAWYFVRRVRF